jgi:hypothetical protein
MATADDACLRINSDERPIEQVRTGRMRRGLVWASDNCTFAHIVVSMLIFLCAL